MKDFFNFEKNSMHLIFYSLVFFVFSILISFIRGCSN